MGFLSMHIFNKMCCVHYVVKYSKPMVDQISANPGLGLMQPHYYITVHMCLRLVLQSDWLFAFICKKQTCYTKFYLKYNIIKWKQYWFICSNYHYLTDGDKTVTFPSNRKTTTTIFVKAIQISEINF